METCMETYRNWVLHSLQFASILLAVHFASSFELSRHIRLGEFWSFEVCGRSNENKIARPLWNLIVSEKSCSKQLDQKMKIPSWPKRCVMLLAASETPRALKAQEAQGRI